jgi:hypothetical protein
MVAAEVVVVGVVVLLSVLLVLVVEEVAVSGLMGGARLLVVGVLALT